MRNAGLNESQAEIKIASRNINNLKQEDDTTLMAESEEELKSLLMRVKEESEKNWLKTQHSKNKIIASGPTTSLQIEGEEVEAMTDFILGAPKSQWTAALKLEDSCSLEGKLWQTWTVY